VLPAALTLEAVEETIVETLAELGPEREEITRDATLESLDIDSLDLVEVAQVIEEEFGVKIGTDDAERLRTVGNAIDLVYERALAR
jgi:acyl carrier protein